MGGGLEKGTDQTLAFARYLSWADLLCNLFSEEMNRQVDAADPDALREHEWRWFGLMRYWYASLHVVVEAWDTLRFSDLVIDRLLRHPNQLRRLFKRHRNGVFHYQKSLLDPRFVELLANGTVHVYWAWALHGEFMRFFAEHLSSQVVTGPQRTQLREHIENFIHWYPSQESPGVDSLERVLVHVRDLLDTYPDDHSQERQDLEDFLESADKTLREGRQNWATMRAQILREVGIEQLE